jgi:lysophospholipase L1-like esterase
MNKFLFTTLLALAYMEVNAQKPAYDTIPYALDYHQKRLEAFSHEPLVKGRIIFLGDSHIEFGDWKKHLNDTTIVNRGVAGDITFGVLNRLQDVIIRHPTRLVIEIGINDIAKNIPNEVIANNILKIVDRIKGVSPKTKIYVHSILPTNDAVKKEYPDAFNKNNRSVKLNQELKSKAVKSGFTYIDLYSMLQDKEGKLNTKYAYEDGLHLNAEGYKLWVATLKSYRFF